MSENSITQKLSTEGADMLTLAGVNDGNLVELSRLGGVKVALRGDTMSISGPVELVARASDIARRMIDRARQRMELTPDDVLRLSEDDAGGDGAGGAAGDGRIALPGVRKLIQASPAAEYLAKIGGRHRRRDRARRLEDVPGRRGGGLRMGASGVAHRPRTPAVEAGRALGSARRHAGQGGPVFRPLYDALGRDDAAGACAARARDAVIEIAPLAFMRGRTLSDAFVILDEAQNATAMQMKMFLTRLGVNSQIVITGDKTQIDLPKREESGLMQVERILPGIDGIAFHYFSDVDVVRHRLVRDIIKAYAGDGD